MERDIVKRVFEINPENAIKNAIKRYNIETTYPYTRDISVTSVLYCLRKAYYDYLINQNLMNSEIFEQYDEIFENNLEDWYIFVGKVVHSTLQDYIRKSLTNERLNVLNEFKVSTPITDEINLTGHIDTLILDKNDALIFEYKTCFRIPSEPYDTHVKQVLTYVKMLKDELPNLNVRAYVIYLERSSGRISSTIISTANDRVNEAFEYTLYRAKTLLRAIEKYDAPDGEKTIQCRNCPYRSKCDIPGD